MYVKRMTRIFEGFCTGSALHEKGKSSYYINPLTRDSIDVSGWAATMSREEIEAQGESFLLNTVVEDLSPSSLRVLVAESPPVKGVRTRDNCRLLWCLHRKYRLPAIVDLKNILVRPSAYSL